MLLNLESPVTMAHRAKLAYSYVLQSSTADQIRQHQESTEAQYRLVNRAAAYGWPRNGLRPLMTTLGNPVRQAAAAAASSG